MISKKIANFFKIAFGIIVVLISAPPIILIVIIKFFWNDCDNSITKDDKNVKDKN